MSLWPSSSVARSVPESDPLLVQHVCLVLRQRRVVDGEHDGFTSVGGDDACSLVAVKKNRLTPVQLGGGR